MISSSNSPSLFWPPEHRTSAVAILETIVISVATLYIDFSWGMSFFLTSAAIAPLFLLRTAASVDFGFRILGLVATPLQTAWRFVARPILQFDGLYSNGKRGPLLSRAFLLPIGIPYAVFVYLTMFAAVLLSMVSIRIFATAYEFVRSLPASLHAVPVNYLSFLAATRTVEEPVLLPGVGYARLQEYDIDERIVDFLRPGQRIRSALRDFDIGLIIIALPLYVVMIVMPAIFGRASVKASLPFYGHLAWTLHANVSQPVESLVSAILHGSFATVSKVFSCLSVMFLCLKLLFIAVFNPQLQRINLFLENSVLLKVIEPMHLPWWQLASGLAGGMTFIAVALCNALESQSELEHRPIIVAPLRTILVARAFLGLYASVCGAYILIDSLPPLEWPQIGGPLFPWS